MADGGGAVPTIHPSAAPAPPPPPPREQRLSHHAAPGAREQGPEQQESKLGPARPPPQPRWSPRPQQPAPPFLPGQRFVCAMRITYPPSSCLGSNQSRESLSSSSALITYNSKGGKLQAGSHVPRGASEAGVGRGQRQGRREARSYPLSPERTVSPPAPPETLSWSAATSGQSTLGRVAAAGLSPNQQLREEVPTPHL